MKRKTAKKPETSPVRHLQLELRELRRELRTTARVYAQRLERDLTVTTDALERYAPAEELTREQLHPRSRYRDSGSQSTASAGERPPQRLTKDRESYFRSATAGRR
jgi:hypothetical protein